MDGIMRPVRRLLLPLTLLATIHCATPAPAPEPAPAPAPVQPAAPAPAPASLGTVRVTASALNVRREASTTAEVIAQLKRGEAMTLLEDGESWSKVRLANGETGYVSSRFIGSESTTTARPKARTTRKGGCPPDSDYAFVETPMLSFSDSSAHGVVVVEATVSAKGDVQTTKVVKNDTGDPALAFLAEREIKKAKFSPPIRNCVARSFIFTYRRTF